MINNPEQLEIEAYLKWMSIQHPDVLVFKIQNEGKRNPRTAKKIGIVAGIPDLQILRSSKNWNGMFIEMKRADGKGKLSANQLACHQKILDENYFVATCKGWEDAKFLTSIYLRKPEELYFVM